MAGALLETAQKGISWCRKHHSHVGSAGHWFWQMLVPKACSGRAG